MRDMIKEIVGKTIKTAELKKIRDDFDDEPFLDIEFTDGSKIRIVASYGDYTGKSNEEYPRYIWIKDGKE